MDDLQAKAKELERHPKLNEGRVVACSHLENSGSAEEREDYVRVVATVAQGPSGNR